MVPLPLRDLDDAADWLRKHFDPQAAAGVRARYRFELSGEGGGTLWLGIEDGQCALRREEAPADVVFRLALSDYLGVLAGRENAELLHMAGRLEIEGDLGLAMKVRRLFGAPA